MAESLRSRVKEAASHDEPQDENPALSPDLARNLEEHRDAVEISTLQLRVDALAQQHKETLDLHRLRLGYTRKIFWLVCVWLGCVVVGVGLSGLKAWGFGLSDAVLIAFITSTTVNVVGLFIVVAKWMYAPAVKQEATPLAPSLIERRRNTKATSSEGSD